MNLKKQETVEAAEAGLEQALKDFRQSVQAWSQAEYGRGRTMAAAERLWSWRLAAGWALGCVLAAGSLAGGLYERHHRQELAAAAARQAHAQQLAAEQRTAAETRQEDEKLFAAVDSEVSRAVPSAMEPLAQLMDEDANP